MMRRWPMLVLASLLTAPAGAPAQVSGIGGPAAGPSTPGPKRVGPPKVPALTVAGLRIEAVHWGRERGFDQNGGYIAALDAKTGRELWTLKIYDVPYDANLEEDVQDVFITRMSKASGGRLAVVDEDGRRYLVDLKTRTVTRGR
jgi:PQQ enzyme repeat